MTPPDGPILLYLGTRNPKKLREIAALLAPPWDSTPRLRRVEARKLAEFPDLPEVVEDADSFAGNARKKASEVAARIGRWVLADDSGLAVDALDGAPGIHSAYYAGTHGADDANNAKLLDALAGVPQSRRGAAFICHLSLADPAGSIRLEAEGACRGRIAEHARGAGGFGYDPLFVIPEYHKSYGELSATVKGQLSHRARAFARLRPLLDLMIAAGEFS